MLRTLTSGTSVESLKKEAKAWLKAVRGGDAEASARLARAHPKAPPKPGLRDIQHAIALEFFTSGWQDLVDQIAEIASSDPSTRALHALMIAAGRGEVASVSAILDAHPELINRRGTLPGQTGRRTALHLAVAHEPVVRLLLERGANPNIRDEGDNAYPLHFVAENQNLAIIRLLVEHGADPIGHGDLHELEVLGWATAWDYVTVKPDIVEYLLAHGARHNIFSAVAVGDAQAVCEIVGRSRTDLERPMDGTNKRRHPLHLAVVKGHPPVLNALLDLGAHVDAEDAAGLTPLDEAALRSETTMAETLIARGARVGLPAAVALQRLELVDRLVAADPGCLRPGGRWGSLIRRAAEHSPAAVIETLLRLGASPDALPSADMPHGDQVTPLHTAASTGNVPAAAVLVKHSATVSIRDRRWAATPAGWARYFGNSAVVDVILAGPIDIFEALDFNLVDRLPQIVERDPGAIDRPFREYAKIPGKRGPMVAGARRDAAFVGGADEKDRGGAGPARTRREGLESRTRGDPP